MTLSKFVTERLKITSKTKSVALRPTTKEELLTLIKQELFKEGRDADLNHIDVSSITDMRDLFPQIKVNVRNIKIDKWDVSNVTNMYTTFEGCKNLNCDLSGWDVSNVTDMRWMFDNCDSFKSDLSGWDVSNVNKYNNMFDKCPNMTADLRPKFN